CALRLLVHALLDLLPVLEHIVLRLISLRALILLLAGVVVADLLLACEPLVGDALLELRTRCRDLIAAIELVPLIGLARVLAVASNHRRPIGRLAVGVRRC